MSGNPTATRIGRKLQRAMRRQQMKPADLASESRKNINHVRAVLAGYPNTKEGQTILETIDEIAGVLGLRLDLVSR